MWVKYCTTGSYFWTYFVFVKDHIYILLHACSATVRFLHSWAGYKISSLVYPIHTELACCIYKLSFLVYPRLICLRFPYTHKRISFVYPLLIVSGFRIHTHGSLLYILFWLSRVSVYIHTELFCISSSNCLGFPYTYTRSSFVYRIQEELACCIYTKSSLLMYILFWCSWVSVYTRGALLYIWQPKKNHFVVYTKGALLYILLWLYWVSTWSCGVFFWC